MTKEDYAKAVALTSEIIDLKSYLTSIEDDVKNLKSKPDQYKLSMQACKFTESRISKERLTAIINTIREEVKKVLSEKEKEFQAL